ncbi:MAG TPA: MBL fold metallo-hydrolase [Pseudolabrys sp.]|nr:MBL fold metallo-hydrolase [Pseudolabrys sp.]
MSAVSAASRTEAWAAEIPFDVDLPIVRKLARVLPGALPIAVNGARIAASIRPQRFVIEGGDDTPVTMPRTAYQVVYPDCTVMIDSGFDQTTHESFGGQEPYFPEEFAKLKRALDAARLIVLTHHHADHVGGVLTAANFAELAGKTIVSSEMARCMVETPHRPHLKLASEVVNRFVLLDYRQYYPVAPGIVLIKAPGHSVDSQMVFIALASGREVLHSVDSAWNMENIRRIKGKAAPWVKEDVPRIMGQLRWLNATSRNERELAILVTHDDALFASLIKSGLLGGQLKL